MKGGGKETYVGVLNIDTMHVPPPMLLDSLWRNSACQSADVTLKEEQCLAIQVT